MKTAGTILAIYLLLVAAIPCCLPETCGEEKSSTATVHSGEEDTDCGSCSPFFHCEGCIAVSIAAEPARFEWAVPVQPAAHTEFLQPALSDAAYEFWQPPRQG